MGQGAVAQESVGTMRWDPGESGDQRVGSGGMGQGAVTQERVGTRGWGLGVWDRAL